MAIKHADVKTSGDKGYAEEWNKDHVIDDDSKPKNFTTLIVAASNSKDTSRADYVCDGVDDQEEINAAIAALPANGGRVSLLEGTFDITNTIVLSDDDISLEGLGYATRIQTTANMPMIWSTGRNHLYVANLALFGSALDTNVGIDILTGEYCMVENCWVENCRSGIRFWNGSNNTITNNFTSGNTHYGIVVHAEEKNIISDNQVTTNTLYGILAFESSEILITGNTSSSNVRHGIEINTSSDCVITNNLVLDNDSGNLSMFDGIYLIGDSNYNIIAGNRCRDNDRWEIHIAAAACDKNLVHGNHCIGPGHFGAISDLGTNTTLADNVVA